jgi:diaminopimelate epimerase
MCGNGVRVFARYLVEAGLVDARESGGSQQIGTRDGVKLVTFCDDGEISVDMGVPTVGGPTTVSANGRRYDALGVALGNPHAVAFVDDLDEVGELSGSPYFCGVEFPDEVNIEFVERLGGNALAMRVYERGVGETQSCGTGACATVAAAATAAPNGEVHPTTYTVRVRGGELTVKIAADGHLHLNGPAVLVAEGTWFG